MKKVGISIFILAVIFASTENLKAQEKGSSAIEIGVGTGTTNELLDSFGNSFGSVFIFGIVTYENERYSPAFYLGYEYAIIDKLMLGVNVAYQNGKKEVYVLGDLEGERKLGFYTLGIEADYHYISNPSFQMYSGLGVGYTLNREKFISNDDSELDRTDNEGNFNFQVTGIGLRFGKALAGYTEIGFGYKGIINAGINYQF